MGLFDAQIEQRRFTRRHLAILAGLAIALTIGVVFLTDPFDLIFGRTEDYKLRVVHIASGLEYPWGLAFLPNGDMLVTERLGRLQRIRNGTSEHELIPGAPTVVTRAQAGLMDIALHPRFSENGLLFLCYSKPGQGDTPALMRAQFDGTRLRDARDIFVTNAWDDSGGNTGCRILFGNDGMIYMSVGDRHRPRLAQDLTTDAGKILRLRDDGTIPADNPFVNRPDVRGEIFTYGNRNPQGLAIDPQTGALYENEHGPRGGDEINLLGSGMNYGWPLITYGINYDGTKITDERSRPGMEQPLVYWVPSIGPSGMVLYTGDRFSRWKGNLFMGAMAGTHLRRVVLDGQRVVHEEQLLRNMHQRIRDVRQGPDGFLYLLTDSDYGQVLRIEPD
jgi:glucose/arabinose dehydrogenase